MTIVKFKQGTIEQLASTNIDNGTVYFIPDSLTNLGNIAFDWAGARSWVQAPQILTTGNLDSSVPKLGTLIVVTDAFSIIDSETGATEYTPGLKIGDGITALNVLPYLNDFSRLDASILQQQFASHITNTDIHHTENAKISDNDIHTLEILNYN